MTIDLPVAYGHTLFCDDVRQESSGKLIFIGAYMNTMTVNLGLPYTMPSLHCSISYYERRNQLSGPLRFCIYIPGDASEEPSFTLKIDEIDDIRNKEFAEWTSDDLLEPKYLAIMANVALQNVILKEEGFIKVRAFVGGDEVRLGSLRVVRAPDS